jgi:hypothetical protein
MTEDHDTRETPMCNALPLGIRVDGDAIPPVAEQTTYLEVGVLSIGVEYRLLTDDIVDSNYEGTKDAAEVDAQRPETLDDEGVSFHVCDAGDGREYLRFDAFRDDPHYHYIHAEGYQQIVVFDAAASGDMLEWTLSCLATRLPEMLRHAGARELADQVDLDAVTSALPDLADLAREAGSPATLG